MTFLNYSLNVNLSFLFVFTIQGINLQTPNDLSNLLDHGLMNVQNNPFTEDFDTQAYIVILIWKWPSCSVHVQGDIPVLTYIIYTREGMMYLFYLSCS